MLQCYGSTRHPVIISTMIPAEITPLKPNAIATILSYRSAAIRSSMSISNPLHVGHYISSDTPRTRVFEYRRSCRILAFFIVRTVRGDGRRPSRAQARSSSRSAAFWRDHIVCLFIPTSLYTSLYVWYTLWTRVQSVQNCPHQHGLPP